MLVSVKNNKEFIKYMFGYCEGGRNTVYTANKHRNYRDARKSVDDV
jgi:hypothetical protein